jgi:biotin-dependent carboxylase-like uncharacterized protein
MSVLVVDHVGPATSVQDGGRFGAQRYGLPPSGVMDRLALAIANVLAGNAPFAAAIEIGPLGARFTVREGRVRLALAGAVREATVAGRPLAMQTTALLAAGDSLVVGAAREGVFSYLGIAGAIPGEPVFGSLSVNAHAGLGHPFARPLQAGDVLALPDAVPVVDERRLPQRPLAPGPIRVVPGPQDEEFSAAARDLFCATEWRISAISDRMGYRLEGPAIAHTLGHDIVSDGTVNGSVQVPGNGQPIVLMPDRGTTGGYPKIATVISADLGRLAQTPPGHAIRFRAVTVEEAQQAARDAAVHIASLASLVHTGGAPFDLAALQNANTAGVAISAVDTATWESPAAPRDREQP